MGLKIEFDRDAIVAALKGIGKDATDAAYKALVTEGRKIRDKAREYAPVDEGDLESAIEEQHSKTDRTVWVGINPTAVDEHGRPISGYGALMHEFQEVGVPGPIPREFGVFGLGPRSQAKDGGRMIVGGKFLERAYKERAKLVIKRAVFAVKRVTHTATGGDSLNFGED